MEEPGMAVQVRESKHPYDNNTNFEVGEASAIIADILVVVRFSLLCLKDVLNVRMIVRIRWL